MSTPTQTRANYACPDATLILKADAPQEAWLETRTQGIGGSDVSALAGLNKWSNPLAVYYSKTSQAPRQEYTQAMRMGHLMEPLLKQMFTEDTGIKVRRAGLMRSKANPFMQVTVDGLTEDGGIFESKTSTGWLSSEWADGQVPDHAELQVQHGMAVTGRSHAWVVGLLDGRDWFIRRIERDQDLIDQIIKMERDFWHNHVLTMQEPPVSTANTVDTLKAKFAEADPDKTVQHPAEKLAQLKAEYDAGKAEEKAGKERADMAAAELRLIIGDATILQDETGAQFAKLANDGTFSESRFKKEHPELWEAHQIETTVFDKKWLQENEPELYTSFRPRSLRISKP